MPAPDSIRQLGSNAKAVNKIELSPFRLRPRIEEKIWGSRSLSPFFPPRAPSQPPVGEAWFTFEEATVEGGHFHGRTLGELMTSLGPALMGDAHRPLARRRLSADRSAAEPASGAPYFPLLAKLLFVSDVLSVQVHPDDARAMAQGGGAGKTEMWHVVSAEPGARVALGLSETLPRDVLAEAARTGEIERYLNWVEVSAGDTVFVPAGLLHTLGPGVVVCEIQQNSDLTYRFFDFNRLGAGGLPRPLHIEAAVDAMSDRPWPGFAAPGPLPRGSFAERRLLAACPYFAAEALAWSEPFEYTPNRERLHALIVLEGEGTIGGQSYAPGAAFIAPAHGEPFRVEPASPSRAVRAYEPDLAAVRRDLASAGGADAAIERLIHAG